MADWSEPLTKLGEKEVLSGRLLGRMLAALGMACRWHSRVFVYAVLERYVYFEGYEEATGGSTVGYWILMRNDIGESKRAQPGCILEQLLPCAKVEVWNQAISGRGEQRARDVDGD